MKDYFDVLIDTMTWLSKQPKIKFIGQSVTWDGHALFKSMKNVPDDQRIELPVFEDFQMGMSIGMALEGWNVINIYPRWDFLITATNQLVNHLANVRYVSNGKYKPRVITRVSVGATTPLHPGIQHCKNHTEAIKLILGDEINVVDLKNKDDIFPAYELALTREDYKPTILVEYTELYHKE